MAMSNVEPQIIPAATVVIMRENVNGPPELLMVERAAAMRFAGGALVFPGGRVDPGDYALAQRYDGDPDDNAARIAAIRETIEEAGLAIGIDRAIDIAAARAALASGITLSELLDGAALDLGALIPFARWRPHRGVSHRVFDTRFYLARLPDDAAEAVADGGESVHLFWATAADVLAQANAGRAQIIFPTRCNLERLAQYDSIDAAIADARAHPVETITPWVEMRDGVEQLCIPERLGYPVTSQKLDQVKRG